MFVYSNLAISLDGKIATSKRGLLPLGSPEDRKHMIRLRKNCDAILVGASTLRSYKRPALIPNHSIQPINAILTSTLEGISPRWEFFTHPGLRRVLFVGSRVPAQALKSFEKSSEIVQLSRPTSKKPIALQILDALKKRGVRNLLVEGGGGVMWNFVSQNRIDEFHVTLTPRILGGMNAPTLVDGAGFFPNQVVTLKLRKCRKVKDEIFLVYSKTKVRGI